MQSQDSKVKNRHEQGERGIRRPNYEQTAERFGANSIIGMKATTDMYESPQDPAMNALSRAAAKPSQVQRSMFLPQTQSATSDENPLYDNSDQFVVFITPKLLKDNLNKVFSSINKLIKFLFDEKTLEYSPNTNINLNMRHKSSKLKLFPIKTTDLISKFLSIVEYTFMFKKATNQVYASEICEILNELNSTIDDFYQFQVPPELTFLNSDSFTTFKQQYILDNSKIKVLTPGDNYSYKAIITKLQNSEIFKILLNQAIFAFQTNRTKKFNPELISLRNLASFSEQLQKYAPENLDFYYDQKFVESVNQTQAQQLSNFGKIIEYVKKLGEGNFGQVDLYKTKENKSLAVKSLNDSAPDSEQKDFEHEVELNIKIRSICKQDQSNPTQSCLDSLHLMYIVGNVYIKDNTYLSFAMNATNLKDLCELSMNMFGCRPEKEKDKIIENRSIRIKIGTNANK